MKNTRSQDFIEQVKLKAYMRKLIAEETEKFLRRGGKIQVIEGGGNSFVLNRPLPKRKPGRF